MLCYNIQLNNIQEIISIYLITCLVILGRVIGCGINRYVVLTL
jgi:hypothetical protein